MGRTKRTVRVGEKYLRPSLAPGTTSDRRIPNYGLTVVSTADGTDFVMDAPVEGVKKSIGVLGITTTTASIVVRGSTGTSVTFNKAGGTQLSFAATVDSVVNLVGYSSTRWVVEGVYPPAAAVNSTGVVVGTS